MKIGKMRLGRTRERWVLLASFLNAFVVSNSLCGDTFEVPPGDAAAIQTAIDQAVDGDTIQLQVGVYTVGSVLDPHGKAISIRGAIDDGGLPGSVLDAAGSGRVLQCISGEAEGTLLTDLVITGGQADAGGGLLLVRTRPTIERCIFLANEAMTLGGAVAMVAAEPRFSECRFESNRSGGDAGGISIQSGDPRFVGCRFVANVAAGSGGAVHQVVGTGRFENATFEGNHADGHGGGLAMADFATPALVGCTIRDNSATGVGGGLSSDDASPTISDSTICGNTGLQLAGSWIDGGDNVIGDVCEDRGQTIVVPVGPASAIQTVIDEAPAGTIIELEAGVYPVRATLETRGRAIRIVGAVDAEGAPASVLDAGGLVRVIRVAGGETRSATLENLVIQGGRASDGGGLECWISSPSVINCRFQDNHSERFGGGVHLHVSDARFERCEFRFNHAGDRGGAVSVLSGDPELLECTVQDNRGRDGIHVPVGEVRLVDTVVCGNAGSPVSGTWVEEGDCTIETACQDAGAAIDVAIGDGALIQSIIDSVPAGSELRLAAGTYSLVETLDLRGLAITIRGAVDKDGMPATVLDGGNTVRVLDCGTGETSATVIEDLVIRNGFADHGGGLRLSEGAAPTIRRCRIESNVATGDGGGIWIWRGGGRFEMTDILDNAANTGGGGVFVAEAETPVRFTGSRISRNQATSGAGISIGEGIVELAGCVVCANLGGQVVGDWTDLGGNTVDLVCPSEGGVIEIPAGDAKALLAALVGAPDGTEVRLSAGTYALQEPVDTFGRGISIIGAVNGDGDPATVLDGMGETHLLQCIAGEGSSTRFENLIIANGRANRGGGAILTRSEPVFENCHFLGNQSVLDGGAVMASAASPAFAGCRFEGNHAMGGGGGAIAVTSGSPDLVDSLLIGNTAGAGGGAVYMSDGGIISFADVIVEANEGKDDGGGIAVHSAGMRAEALTVEGNSTAGRGGGVVIGTGGWAEIGTSVIRDNIAAEGAGGILAGGTSLTMNDSLVCGNSGDQIVGDWENVGGNDVLDDCADRGGTIVIEPGDGGLIQAAIEDSGNGTVIQLMAGVYEISAPIDSMGRAITVLGAVGSDGRPLSVLDAGGRCGVIRCVTGESTDTVFRNLRITNGLASEGGGAFVRSSSPTFDNCEFLSNVATVHGGGLHLEQSDAVLAGTVVRSNQSQGDGGGLHIFGGEPVVSACIVRDNFGFAGITAASAFPMVSNSVVCGNTGVQIAGEWSDGGGNSVSRACEGEGQVVEVLAGPVSLLQEAIDQAINGDVIQIGSGIVDVDETIDLKGKAIVIRGSTAADGSPRTVLDGGGAVRIMVCRSGESAATLIQDLEFRDGSATNGGALLVSDDAGPTIRNCVFTGNVAGAAGGAIHATFDAGSVLMIGCRFENNEAASGGGVSIVSATRPWMIKSSEFHANVASFDGGAISSVGDHEFVSLVASENSAARRGGAFSMDGAPVIRQCEVVQNTSGERGGGAHLSGEAQVVGGLWRENESDLGGGLFCGGRIELIDTVVQSNIATSRGGGLVVGGEHAITGSIVSENRAELAGGGIDVMFGSVVVSSSSVCRNLPDQIVGSWSDGGEGAVTEECEGYSSPDLEVESVDPRTPAGTIGETISVDWTIRNAGGAVARGPWRNRMFLTDDPLDGQIWSGPAFEVEVDLEPQFSLSAGVEGVDVTLPSMPGSYWFALEVDIDGVVAEFGGEANNRSDWFGPIDVLYPPSPDLVSEVIGLPEIAVTGEAVPIRWATRNAGERAAGPFWTDRLTLNRTEGYGSPVATVEVEVAGPLPGNIDAEMEIDATLVLPETPGDYWLHVDTDAGREIEEYEGEANNRSALFGPIRVEYPPHPDLDLGRLVFRPTTVPGGESVTVSWQACNVGSLATSGFWVDRIYLSDDAVAGNDLLLGEFVRAGTIEPGACVDYAEVVELPLLETGFRHLVVRSDVADQLFEGDGDGDGSNVEVSANAIEIVEPALADLGITNVVAPSRAIAGTEVEVVWFGANEGELAAGPTWTDRVYLSADDVLDPSDLNISDRFHVGLVSPGGAWTDALPVRLPDITGSRYLIVEADARDNVEEGSGDAGNWKASSSPIVILPEPSPNLIPEVISVPESAVAGDTVQISWRVRNDGGGVAEGFWSDAVYLSDDANLDSGDALLRLQPKAGPIESGTAYVREFAVELPVDYESGNRRLIVRADRDNELEEDSESDNLAVSPAFFVAKTPAADLAVFDVAFEESELQFGGEFDVSFRVENRGDAPASVAWSDLVLISSDAVVNTGDFPIATASREADPLLPGASYDVNVTCELPLTNDLPDGLYRIIVVADVSEAVPEPVDSNNRAFSSLVPVSRPPLGDLRVDVLGMPLDVLPIEPFDITLRFSNDGESEISGNWFTTIQLRGENGSNPLLLQEFITAQQIPAGNHVDVQRSVQIPDRPDALITLGIEVDSRDNIVEADETNNQASSSEASYRRPDLVPIGVSLPDFAYAGDLIEIVIEGRNQGTAPANAAWVDLISLSADDLIGADRAVGSGIFGQPVPVGGTFTYTVLATLPEDLEGDFHPVLRVDTGNQLLELDDLNPPLLDMETTISIAVPDRPNLVPESIASPSVALAGDSIEVAYSVSNRGEANADPAWIDRLWFSRTPSLGADAVQVAKLVRTDGLGVNDVYDDIVTVVVPETPGNWYLVLETDAVDTVRESVSGEGDNRLVAATALYVQGVQATAWFVEDEVSAGDPLTIRGHAVVAGTSQPAASASVHLQTNLRGFPAALVVETDSEGVFETEWTPGPDLGGRVSLRVASPEGGFGAAVDEAVIWGLDLPPLPAVVVVPGGTAPLAFNLRNLTDLPATGVLVDHDPSGANEDVSIETTLTGSDVLAPDESRAVLGTVHATEEASGSYEMSILAESDQASPILQPLLIEVVESVPSLIATPSRIQSDAVLDVVSYTDVTIRNIGLASTGTLEVLLSNFEFAQLVGQPVVSPLEPGEEATISIRLSPTGDLTQGSYTASPGLVVRDPEDPAVFVAMDVEFNVTSASYATIEVQATSEFSYFGVPPIHPDATVEVTREADGAEVAAGTVDDEGRIRFERLEPGIYRVRATADRHGSFSTLVNAQGGQVNAVEAFMPRSVLSYVWDVVPIEFTDEYIITLSLTYETNVPAPVVTIDPIVLDFGVMTAPTQAVEVRLTNHGLITASNVRWGVSNTERLQIIPLNSNLGDIPPGATITTSVLLVDQEFNASGVAGAGGCDPSIGLYYECYCGGETRVSSVPMGVISPPQQCGGDIVLPPSSPPPGGGGGGAPPPGNVNVPPQTTQQAPCEECGSYSQILDCTLEIVGTTAWCGASFFDIPTGGVLFKAACTGWNTVVCYSDGSFSNDDIWECTVETSTCWLPFGYCACNVGSAIQTCFCFPPGLPCGFGPPIPGTGYGPPSPGTGGLWGLGDAEGLSDYWDVPDDWWGTTPPPGGDDPFGSDPPQSLLDIYRAHTNLIRIQRPWAYVFGAWDWLNLGDSEEDILAKIVLTHALRDAALSGSELGSRVSDLEAEHILSLPTPSLFGVDLVAAAIDRINRTQDYRDQGWFSAADVPAGLSLDFLDMSALQSYTEIALQEAGRLQSLGYETRFSELDEAHEAFKLELLAIAEQEDSGQGQCVQIELELEQRLMVTREAFEARLELTNDGDVYVEGIRVDVNIETQDGQDASGLFAVLGPDVTGMGNVSGSGVLEPGETGNAVWTLVPGDSAAPDGMVPYWVSGEIIYTLQGQVLSIPLYPIRIEVHPNASLELQYFIESPVIGDDPFTPEIEPSVPFSLGLWMKNNGAGVAGDVRIESGQPEIVSATSGGVDTEVLIDFLLIGSEVNGEPISPSLDVAFGDLGPEEVGVARWLMICSLQGEFTGYSATVQSVNGFDDPEFSIVDAIDINRLEHVVRGDEPFDDGIPDFLVDLVADPDDLPDTVFLSSTAVEPVVVAVDPPFSTGGGRTATIEAGPAGSWRFIRIDDPFNAAYPLSRVVRDDGKELQLGFNAWQVDYIDRSTPTPTPRRYVKIFDRGGSGVYFLEFDTDATPPSLLTWRSMKTHDGLGSVGLDLPMGSPASEPRGPVSTLVVTFDEPVASQTISAASIALTGLDPEGRAIDPDAFTRSLQLGAGEISATIGFEPPLPPGRYCIRLVGVTDQAGNFLDGETSRLDLAVTPGDVSGDLIVDVVDSTEVSNLLGIDEIDRFDPWQVRADLDRDGDIDLDDADIVNENRPTDHSVLITTCTLLNLGDDRADKGLTLSVATASDALNAGAGSFTGVGSHTGGRPSGGSKGAWELFETAVGETMPLGWTDGDSDPVAFPVILNRIAVRHGTGAERLESVLAGLGIDRGTIVPLAEDGWFWASLPTHLASPAGHASIGARLAGRGIVSSPVVAVGPDRVMVANPGVLLDFDPLIPSDWQDRAVEEVSPGAHMLPSVIEDFESWRLVSSFGGDAVADAEAFRHRSEVRFVEPMWRMLPTPAGAVPAPPLSTASLRWMAHRADIDHDGRITALDLETFAAAALAGEHHPRLDLNGDGVVDMIDFVEASEAMAP